MKYSYISCLVLGLLVQLSVPTGVSCAEIGSEEKFELMAAALRARDAGDLVTARQFLEQLRYAYPSDPNLERLLRGVNARIDMAAVTGEGDLVSPNNTPPGFSSVEGSPIAVSVSDGMDIDALDAMVKAEAERQELALEEAQVARVSAEELMDSGEYEVALAVINRALETLPVSIKTAPMLDGLKSLKRDIIFEQAEEAYFAKEVDRSRNLLARFEKLGGRDERSESLSRKLAGRDRGTVRASQREYSPALNERDRELEELAALGIAQFERGYLEAAKGTFAQIEVADPGNAEAKHYQARIAEERQQVGRLDRYKTKGEMLHEVGQGWQRPQVFDRESGAGGGEEENGLREKLQRIVLPRVSFGGVALSRVIDTLSELSVDYDPEREGVNFVVLDPAGSDPKVNITLRNLPLNRILDFVVESAGYEYDIQADAVVVRQGMDGGIRLETEFYPISRSTIIRLTGIGAKSGSRSVSYDPFAPVPETQSGVARSHGGGGRGAKELFAASRGTIRPSAEREPGISRRAVDCNEYDAKPGKGAQYIASLQRGQTG